MDADVKVRKPKFDLNTMIGPLDQKPEPKTLIQCLHEAGGFPFAARTIVTIENQSIPTGTDVRLLGWGESKDHIVMVRDIPKPRRIIATVARWELLGHKT